VIIRTTSHPRAGLVGNPSDGYFGKTISFIVKDFAAEIVLYETPELEILPAKRDHSTFSGIGALAQDVRQFGYYGGLRLLKASIKRFHDYCSANDIDLHSRNFTIRYTSNIPSQVGMAGSSAIITACFRALMSFYGVTIPKPILPSLILSVENDELKIPAGLQDRVIQTYEGLVYMDFEREHLEAQGHGHYEELDVDLLPPLYLAYTTNLSEGTEVFHNDIRSRFNRGEEKVVDAMKFWADLTVKVRDALVDRKPEKIGPLLNANFEKRREVYTMGQGNIDMVETARSVGASAKFTGSGGAIVGTYDSEEMFEKLCGTLEPMGMKVFKPTISS